MILVLRKRMYRFCNNLFIAPLLYLGFLLQIENAYGRSDVYCGIYCLYMALELAGSDVEFETLLEPEYVDSPYGSSLGGLVKAASDHGFHAQILKNLSCRDLCNLPYPALLYTKAEEAPRNYGHFELFLGCTDDGKLLLCDPPKPTRHVSRSELAPRWGGGARWSCRRTPLMFPH